MAGWTAARALSATRSVEISNLSRHRNHRVERGSQDARSGTGAGRQAIGRYEANGYGYWLALDRLSGAPIGQMGLVAKSLDGVDEVELAYMVHRPFWRTGYATEAASACRDYAFATLNRARVLCLIRPENTPSIGVARKIGLKTDGRIITHFGSDHIVYAGERSL